MSNQTPLPSFLPHPGEQLRKLFPLGHIALVDVLGLSIAYLKGMHPTKQARNSPEMLASAHILSHFLNDPLVKAILLVATPSQPPSKELSALQGQLTSLENTLTTLAKAPATAKNVEIARSMR